MFDRVLGTLMTETLPYALGTSGEQRLSILTYHRVMEHWDPIRWAEPTAEKFNWQIRTLSQHFKPLLLSEALEKMKHGTLPKRAVAVTFDDGYADNCTVAMPILRRWGVPATVFVATKYLNGGAMWNDKVIESVRNMPNGDIDLRPINLDFQLSISEGTRADVAQELLTAIKHWSPNQREEAVDYISSLSTQPQFNLMLDDDQLLRLQENNIEIGGHTNSHPTLATISDGLARKEILEGKEILEEKLRQPLRVFAYPNGRMGSDFNQKHKKIVKEAGFQGAVTTEIGTSSARTDPYELPRFTPWDPTPLRFLLRLHHMRRQVIDHPLSSDG